MQGTTLINPGRQIDSLQSPRFSQVTTFARLAHTRRLENVRALFLGVPFDDGTTFRPGARFGPRAVREASRLLRRYNPIVETKPFEELSMVDYGDVDVVPGYIEETYARIVNTLEPILEAGIFPIACGGDHSISLGILRAASKKYGKLSLIHYDAHSDCGDIYFGKKYGHGTPFRRALEENLIDPAHSIHVGLRGSTYDESELSGLSDMGFSVISMHEYARIGHTETIKRIREKVVGPAYISLDIDGVDPAYAPGTGMPEAGGFTSREMLDLVRGLEGLPFVGFDLVEVSPLYDVAEITAVLASNLIYEFCSIVAKAGRDEII